MVSEFVDEVNKETKGAMEGRVLSCIADLETYLLIEKYMFMRLYLRYSPSLFAKGVNVGAKSRS